ncbi:MAG: alkaline shock response membrane anchor protein AmaP [Clostridia bacterium]|nr:alkaline shock response membrane anchor protein AmaP [Clostridia bacterium]
MNAARRLIVIIFGLAFIALGVLFMATLVNYTVYPYWTAILDKLFTESKIIIAVIAVCLIVVGAFSFYSGVAKKAETKIAKISSAEGAGVNISLEAIDSVVKIAASRVVNIKDVKSKVIPSGDGVSVSLSVSVPDNTSVPQTASQLQTDVKAALEMMTGLKVNEVKVLINSISSATNTNVPKVQ